MLWVNVVMDSGEEIHLEYRTKDTWGSIISRLQEAIKSVERDILDLHVDGETFAIPNWKIEFLHYGGEEEQVSQVEEKPKKKKETPIPEKLGLRTMIDFEGEAHMIKEWSEIKEIPAQTIMYRINKGWPLEEVFNTPVGFKR